MCRSEFFFNLPLFLWFPLTPWLQFAAKHQPAAVYNQSSKSFIFKRQPAPRVPPPEKNPTPGRDGQPPPLAPPLSARSRADWRKLLTPQTCFPIHGCARQVDEVGAEAAAYRCCYVCGSQPPLQALLSYTRCGYAGGCYCRTNCAGFWSPDKCSCDGLALWLYDTLQIHPHPATCIIRTTMHSSLRLAYFFNDDNLHETHIMTL